MFTKALIVFLVHLLCQLSSHFYGDSFFNRPIVTGALVGLALGDLGTGAYVAAYLELMWVGMIFFAPVNVTNGAAIGVAVAILSGVSVEVAATVALAVGLLGGQIENLSYTLCAFFTAKTPELAENGELDKINRIHIGVGLIECIVKSLPVFFAVWLGAEYVGGWIDMLPQRALDALTAVGNLLPAVGFGMLLNILWEKKFLVFYFIGFTLSVYLQLPIMAIAILACCVAIFYFFITDKEESL